MLLNRDELATIARDGIGGLLPRLIDEIEALESAPDEISALKSQVAALDSRVRVLEGQAPPTVTPSALTSLPASNTTNLPQPGLSNGG